ncbi:MAG: recombinase family protein [Acidimicrobiaceae bacterium]|nr:recombinase family protein [Acidimicrobiaceae bacterium]
MTDPTHPTAEHPKIRPTHLERAAVVYVRQSTPGQIERNSESTDRQYALVERAVELGWLRRAVEVIDEDLGISGSGSAERRGFARLTTEVALGRVGIVLGLEVSRLARNNADWYRLLDLAGITDTLIADADGIYHPSGFNDRLVLGLKGTMSEAELHVLRARLEGGIRNKAARGELRRGLPVGLVWGEEDGQVLLHPDESVRGVIASIFERFAELGSVRAVWLWLRAEELLMPTLPVGQVDLVWIPPAYPAIHRVLTHPSYAGAYVYGRTRRERRVDDEGRVRTKARHLERSDWQVLIVDHHPGYIDWATYEANQVRIGANTRPRAHAPGSGAVREGTALLQGLATCGRCGRRLAVHYQGVNSTPGYHCANRTLVNGRGVWCLSVGGVQIDQAVSTTFLAALAPAGVAASVAAAEVLEADHDTALDQWRRQVERARYEANRAERRYLAVDPDNRLVARGLETDWEAKLGALNVAQAELTRRAAARPRSLTNDERAALASFGADVDRVWSAPSTTDRDRKELLRTLVEEVRVDVHREDKRAELTVHWRGGATTELSVELPRANPPTVRTDEDTIALLRRLAVHYPDATIAGILNRQGRRSATGQRFTATIVQGLRHHWKIPRRVANDDQPDGELVTLADAAKVLGVVPSTVHRWLADGFIAGEQLTPGAPWRIRLTDELRGRFVDDAPPGWLAMLEATHALGVSRQTVLQRVKRGELDAVHVRSGRRKGLRIRVDPPDPRLFDQEPAVEGAV